MSYDFQLKLPVLKVNNYVVRTDSGTIIYDNDIDTIKGVLSDAIDNNTFMIICKVTRKQKTSEGFYIYKTKQVAKIGQRKPRRGRDYWKSPWGVLNSTSHKDMPVTDMRNNKKVVYQTEMESGL